MRRRDESGAFLPMVAILVVMLVAIAAFAIDIGMQRVARRDMQAVADAVALDLARLIDGRTAGTIEAGGAGVASLEAARAASVARNGSTTVGEPPVVEAVLINLDVLGEPVLNPDGSLHEVADPDVPDAVYVTAETAVDFAFAAVTGIESGGVSRAAVGASQSNACFKLGSFALALDSSNSGLLADYVNDAMDVSVASYDGLADASITLGGLAAELGAGSVQELAQVENLSLADLFSATATVLSREGGNAADVDLLEHLSASVASTLNVDIDELMDLSSGGSAALATGFNVLDLVAGAAFVANGTNALATGVLWNYPQFSQGSTALRVIEGPQATCGAVSQASASTAQLQMEANPTLNLPTIAGLSGPGVVVDLDVDLAQAHALLTGVVCGIGNAASPESFQVSITRALSTARLDIPIHLTGQIKASDIILTPLLWGLLSLGGGTKATVDLTIQAGFDVSWPASTVTATYSVPPHTYNEPEHVGGTTGVVLPTVTVDSSDFSGTITLNGVVKNLSSLNLLTSVTFTPILNDLVQKNVLTGINSFIADVNSILTPLSRLLGIQTGGADLFGLPRPTCHDPVLAG